MRLSSSGSEDREKEHISNVISDDDTLIQENGARNGARGKGTMCVNFARSLDMGWEFLSAKILF